MEQELILGRYRPLADLGEGGHGAVELAFDTKMSRRVAIKRIPLSRAGVRRLSDTSGLKEARTAALLNHPNVVTVYEWDADDDEAFLIMEHIDGVSLAALLDEYSPLDPDEAAAIMTPVCAALSFAHANGVLHLDLKPENVLITRDGHVKVADFGVASLTNAAGQAISAGGTLGYMPPEQLRGDAVDARCDVWALGTLTYELLTGAVPFAADTVPAALHRAERFEPPMPSELAQGVGEELDDVLAEALSPQRSERQPTADEFAEQCLPLLGDPERGRNALRELVESLAAEEGAEEPAAAGLWERLAAWEPSIRRAASAVSSAFLAWAGVSAVGVGWPPAAGAAAVAGVAGAIAPPYGLAVGMLAAIVGAFVTSPALGAAAAVFGVAWWSILGRHGDWDAIAPLAAPLFGVFSLSPALPVLIGMTVRDVRRAFAAGAAAGALLVAASLASGKAATSLGVSGAALLAPLAPEPWRTLTLGPRGWIATVVVIATWAAASGTASVFARRRTRGAALVGAAIGLAATFAGTGPWMTAGLQLVAYPALVFGLSSILVAVVIALGPPPARETGD